MRTAIPPLTLLQLMKAVVYFAVAFACVSPMLRLWQGGGVNGGSEQGLVAVAIFSGIAVPLAWACLTLFVIRRETLRDRLVVAFLLGSVSMAEGFASWAFFAFTLREFLQSPRITMSTVLGHSLVMLLLGAAMAFLVLRLWRNSKASRIDPGAEERRGGTLWQTSES